MIELLKHRIIYIRWSEEFIDNSGETYSTDPTYVTI